MKQENIIKREEDHKNPGIFIVILKSKLCYSYNYRNSGREKEKNQKKLSQNWKRNELEQNWN